MRETKSIHYVYSQPQSLLTTVGQPTAIIPSPFGSEGEYAVIAARLSGSDIMYINADISNMLCPSLGSHNVVVEGYIFQGNICYTMNTVFSHVNNFVAIATAGVNGDYATVTVIFRKAVVEILSTMHDEPERHAVIEQQHAESEDTFYKSMLATPNATQGYRKR